MRAHLERLVADGALKNHSGPLLALLPLPPPAPAAPAAVLIVPPLVVVPTAVLIHQPKRHAPARLLLLAAGRLRVLPLPRLLLEPLLPLLPERLRLLLGRRRLGPRALRLLPLHLDLRSVGLGWGRGRVGWVHERGVASQGKSKIKSQPSRRSVSPTLDPTHFLID